MKRWWVMSAVSAALLSCCVGRGAKVKTPRGLRKIEELEVGEEVIVVDPETLEQHTSVVTAIRRAPRECGRLHFAAGSLTVTSAHPLFDPRAKEWAPAGDWLLGVREEFVGEDGPQRVTQAERFVGVEEVFDLSVAHALHTFVADGVVVHNKPTPPYGSSCDVTPTDKPAFYVGAPCACGPSESELGRVGRVACVGEPLSPVCECSFDVDQLTTWWRTEQGSTESALRDGNWWSRVERGGPSEVLQVQDWNGDDSLAEGPHLPGSPNELLVRETGDGSSGVLVREFADAGSRIGVSAWLHQEAPFSRAVALVRDGQELISLSIEPDRALLTTPDARRWVATGAPPRWLKHQWSLELMSPTAFRLRASVTPSANGAPLTFRAEDTGESLDDFYADGGMFSFGDAGVPNELRLGRPQSSDGGVGALRVTGVTVSTW